MFNFEIESKYFKEIDKVICAVADECRLNISKSGITSAIVDPANVMMVNIEIPISIFNQYKIKEVSTIGYNSNIFGEKTQKRSIKSLLLNSKTPICFDIKSQDGISVGDWITTADISYDIFKEKVFLLNPVNIRREPKVPKMDLNTIFTVSVEVLKKIIKRGEYIKFTINNDNTLICSGENWKSIPISINSNVECHSMFSKEHLEHIVKSIPKNVKEIKMSMSTDYPCEIEFNICDGNVPIKYLLAPRIESD